MDNLTIITQEFEELKGQFIISFDSIYRLIGIAQDEYDYYYCLYDGRKLRLTSCVLSIIPLKGYIREKDYNEMIRIAKLNHFDQSTLWGIDENIKDFNEKHKNELTENWDENTKFILGPYWELN